MKKNAIWYVATCIACCLYAGYAMATTGKRYSASAQQVESNNKQPSSVCEKYCRTSRCNDAKEEAINDAKEKAVKIAGAWDWKKLMNNLMKQIIRMENNRTFIEPPLESEELKLKFEDLKRMEKNNEEIKFLIGECNNDARESTCNSASFAFIRPACPQGQIGGAHEDGPAS